MKLVFLYGRPAVGKVTVARELSRITGWRLFHNHLAVNVALALYDFGSPGFIALREEVWFAALRRALADRLPVLIFTFNPENTVPQRFIDQLFSEVRAAGGEVILAELVASEAAIEARLASDSRRKDGKLVDVGLYCRLRRDGVFDSPIIPSPELQIDTTITSPAEAAKMIAGRVDWAGG
jgi:hypothetical protein